MLVLQRMPEQSIMVGDDVTVKVVSVRGNKVKLGITAPRSLPVHRLEVYNAIKASGRTRTTAEPS